MRARHSVAQVLEKIAGQLPQLSTNTWQLRTLHALRKCRTAALGGHLDRCDDPDCHRLHLSYNSCRNRHCPKCQGHKREQWIRAREAELLDVPYFHVVFTLPHELNTVCLCQAKEVYGMLFKTAWSVIRDMAANPKFMGGRTGMVAVLHTWGQNLSLHPHLHCIVPGGGLSPRGKWRQAKGKGKYLFPVKAMSKIFRARFVARLRKDLDLPPQTYDKLFAKDWTVYCKRPFFGPKQVVEYLGRYTHKIAISDHRITGIEGEDVSFTAKDYRHGGKKHKVKLTLKEFVRRFSQHILPKGFVRIRHYGILASAHKKVLLPKAREQVGAPPPRPEPPPIWNGICPRCKKGRLITVLTFDSRGPPQHWMDKLRSQHHAPKK